MYFLFFLTILLSACNRTKEIAPVLQEAEALLGEYPDSALTVLENLYPGKEFNRRDRSLYYLLLTEARGKNDISLIESDSLIDYAIKTIDAKVDPDLSAKAYLFKGRIQNELQEPAKAAEAFLKGISLLEEKKKAPSILSKLYDELGSAHLCEFQYDEALGFFRKEYEIDQEIGDPRGIAFSLMNFGSVYLFQDKIDSALHYFDEALEYAKQSPDSVYLSDYIHNNLSILHLEKGKYSMALLEIDKIKNLHESDLLNKAKALIYLGQADSAHILLLDLISSHDINIRCIANRYLGEIAERRNDFEIALQYRKEYISIFSRIIEQNRAAEIQIVDHKHNWETAASKLKNRHRQRLNFIGFLGLFTGGFLFYLNRKRKAEKDQQDKEIANLRAEIALSENTILKLQHENEKNFSLLEEKKEEKKRFANSLLEIEKKIFMKKKIYFRILKIAPSKNNSQRTLQKERERLKKEELIKLVSDVKESFAGTIKQKQQDYPEESTENIIAYCLRQSDFTSSDVGWFLNKDGSTIRHKTSGIM